MAKRVDAEDTVDVVTHFLHRWQAEGFGVAGLTTEVEYGQSEPGARKLPVGVDIVIRLVPSRGER